MLTLCNLINNTTLNATEIRRALEMQTTQILTWLEYRTQLEELLPNNTIENNYKYFKDAHEVNIDPVEATKLLLQ